MKKSNISIFIIFLIFSFLLSNLAWPYRHAILFALILSGIFYPLMGVLTSRFKLSEHLAGISICIGITLGIFAPFTYLIYEISGELIIFSQYIKLDQISKGSKMLESFYLGDGIISTNMRNSLEYLNIAKSFQELEKVIITFFKDISVTAFNIFNSWIGDLLGNILAFLLQYIIMLLFIYALLRNGKYIKDLLSRIVPLPKNVFNITLDKFNQMNFVTLVCNGVGGIIQGSVAGVLFWIAGIETVFLWTIIMIVLAFIPLVGMSLVYIPTFIYLLIIGKWVFAIMVLAGCVLISFMVENIYKPKFIGKRLKINSLLLLFGLIGGLSFFGAPGIFYGPIIVTMFLTFVQFVEEELTR